MTCEKQCHCQDDFPQEIWDQIGEELSKHQEDDTKWLKENVPDYLELAALCDND